MPIRHPYAPNFYPGNLKSQMEAYEKAFTPPEKPTHVVAGIVPHAGWFFSGETAARVFMSIKAGWMPATLVLFGTVHVPGVRGNSLYPEGAWDTPLGPVTIDEGLAGAVLAAAPGLVSSDPRAHNFEHSIEVQTPMIKHLFPDARILPIATPPGPGAVEIGQAVGSLIKREGISAVVVGSTDLTHYGYDYGFAPAGYGKKAYDWMVGNDMRIIELALSMKSGEILQEAARNHNACGPGAMAAAVAAAKAMGAAGGHLVQHTTSYDVYPTGEFEMGVGYAGIVF